MPVTYRTSGSGPLVLLLHGIGSAAASFEPQLSGLAADRTLIAWNAAGYAGSPDPTGPPRLDVYVAQAAELIGAHSDAGAHLVGVSWGGVIALRLAATRPELVRSLVVAGASLGSGVSLERAAQMRQRVLDLDRDGPAEFARARGPRLLSPRADERLVESVVATMTGSIRLPGYRAAAETMAATDLTADLARILAPTLVLAGADDTVTGPERAREIHGGIAGAALVTVPGAGHLVNQERPEIFNAWVHAFTQLADRLHDRKERS